MSAPSYRLAQLAEVLGATLHGDGDARIEHIAIDSRKPFPAGSTLFIALRGHRHDGHRYIPELRQRGVRNFLVLADHHTTAPDDSNLLVVRDTLDALQRLAGWHRSQFRAPVIGITGSNGKTVVKEWLFQLLRGHEHIVRSPGSWNSQVGVPLSVWEMRPEHSLGIFEAGISQPGEMDRLRATIKPTIGVFTNIGPAHGENFHSDLEKALEKARLFNDAEALVYCADHPAVCAALDKSALDQRVALRGWSRERNGWLHVVHEQRSAQGTRITVINDAVSFDFSIPFTDQASVENALHCVTLLLHLGHGPQWIAERMPHLAPVAMRLETVEGLHGSTLVNDAYINDLASLAIALDHLGLVAGGRPKAIVLSDIAGSGDAPDLLYTRVADLLKRAGVSTILGVGPNMQAHAARFGPGMRSFADAQALLTAYDPQGIGGHAVLVKGARSFALEQVVQRWQRQVHGTVLEIDLEALRHNLNHYRALVSLAPAPSGPDRHRDEGRRTEGVKIMAMVKAFGYGSGAVELARLFAHEQVHYLGVAYADEGVELRQQGIQLPILVMNPEPVPFEVMLRYRLEAELYDARSLAEAAAFAAAHPEMPPVHLKLDTGMHRLGFTAEELPELLTQLGQAHKLRVASVFSHLVGSEDPAHDTFTHAQLAQFAHMADRIDAVLGYRPLRHIANTAAISRFPEAHLDMVRLGIGLHGVGCNAAESALLRPVAALRSPIAQVKTLQPGATVGYGRSWRTERERRIATLPIGYADGLSRRLSNGVGRVWIHGRPAAIVGKVCMDMVMVDVSDIPCTAGDMAVLFNATHPITEFAEAMGTIPYEALTGIAQRVKRVYVQG